MTTVTLPQPTAPATARQATQLRGRRVSARREFAIVFSLSAAILFGLGLGILSTHAVYSDAESRLTHAYMAVWDSPAKLATIGFVWPPLQTIALLPLVVIKPLATSLVALPLFSALWGGLMIAVLNRTLTLLRLHAGWRYALLAAWCLNPLFLDYSTNGMAEIQYMALMAIGLHYFIAWWLGGGRSNTQLCVSGVAMGFAFLTRYEVAAWTVLMAAGVFWVAWPRRRRWSDVEAPLLLFLAPTLYMAGVWSVISMMVIGGGPLSWLTRAGNQGYVGSQVHAGALHVASDVLSVTTQVGPALWIVPAGLLILALVRRDAFTVMLAAAITLGAGVTLALMLHTPSTGLLQPRYNIRSLGPLVIGAGWLIVQLGPPWLRRSAGVVIIAALLTALPTARHLMLGVNNGEERAFVRALTTGASQDGTITTPNYREGIDQDRRFARFLNAHTHQAKSVLIDDAAFPGVILFSGRPQLFVALTDHGTGAWQHEAIDPWGHIRYMVVGNPDDVSSGFSTDLISTIYPTAYAGGLAGARVIMRTRWGAVLELARREPVSDLLAQATADAGLTHDRTNRLVAHRRLPG